MGVIFDPITGQIILIPESSGGGSPTPQTPNYVKTFNSSSDWGSPSGGIYTLNIPATTHGKGLNPIVQVMESISGHFESVVISHSLSTSGDISLEVNATPDNRFAGKIIISENN